MVSKTGVRVFNLSVATISSLLLLVANTNQSFGQRPPSLSVEFVARGMQPTLKELWQGDSHAGSLGHVFMIISIPTLHGPKEEAYGFYPRNETGTGVIKGPGLAKSEYRCGSNDDCNPSQFAKNLKRFSEIEDSVRIDITEDQRKQIMTEVEIWNHKEYRLLTENCEDFVNTVVKDLDYSGVSRAPLQTPVTFMQQLKMNIHMENQLRELRAKEKIAAEEAARAEKAAQRNKHQDCKSGVFQEANPNLVWSLTFNGDDLTGQRTDGMCYFHLSRTGETWTGSGGCRQQPLKLVMRANDGCTQLTSNLAIFCPVLNRK